MPIAENIARLEEKIQKACNSAGRKRSGITLMGVSKFVPAGMIEEAYNNGIRFFGESRVKESLVKLNFFRDNYNDAEIHLIGSLQRNKAKQAALFFDCIQSVDRIELVNELVKHSSQRGKPLGILFELHTGEESKRGFSGLDGLFSAAEQALKCGHLLPLGLMTMAPFFKPPLDSESKESIRRSFRQLVKAQGELIKHFPSGEGTNHWSCLSMGMSNDFEIAVEEGSTMLRIGSLIFND